MFNFPHLFWSSCSREFAIPKAGRFRVFRGADAVQTCDGDEQVFAGLLGVHQLRIWIHSYFFYRGLQIDRKELMQLQILVVLCSLNSCGVGSHHWPGSALRWKLQVFCPVLSWMMQHASACNGQKKSPQEAEYISSCFLFCVFFFPASFADSGESRASGRWRGEDGQSRSVFLCE